MTPAALTYPAISFILQATVLMMAAEAPIPPVPDQQPKPPFAQQVKTLPEMLVPGFIVRELPVKLTSLNNVEYASDGRLFAGGYDGRFHLLRDTDGDGLEDKVDTFSPESSPNYPLGMVVKDGEPYAVLTDELVCFRDTNGDGIPDKRETVAKGFDDPELVAAKYLNHRRVDSSMALAYGPDGAWYVTMGNAGYNNPYWQDKFEKGQQPSGTPHYSPEKRRGCLLRITADGKVEQLASGLRYIMSLQFNKAGDLFGSEQEGATWVPNGNPFDELLHIQPGRHYGFPPRHPTFLPDVVDEPSVWDYAPQHQSTCGFRFNTPGQGRGLFGPRFWEDDALMTGESRGKLWRTSVVKTAAGYVASNQLIANVGLLAVDCAISPTGDLLLCCHTGKPDWGNGPQGEGRLFKITYQQKDQAQPVLSWAASETETIITFDREIGAEAWADLSARASIDAGRYVEAGHHLETMRPGYQVVQMQQRQAKKELAIQKVSLEPDQHSLRIQTQPRSDAVNYALHTVKSSAGPKLALAYDLHGLATRWEGMEEKQWSGWLPHPDLTAARGLTRQSHSHEALWPLLKQRGRLQLRTQLDLFNMLQPATQPGSDLGYKPQPETVTLVFKSDAALTLEATKADVERISPHESRITVAGTAENVWTQMTLSVTTPMKALDVSYFTDRDPRPRAPSTQRFLLPFAQPAVKDVVQRNIPELAGGDWQRGAALYKGKAACFTCHVMRSEGVAVGPDLNNLIHRDYASVLRDILEPSAVINPDAVGYVVSLKNGSSVVGTRTGESEDELTLTQPGGLAAKLAKKDIIKAEPMALSLMPAGMDKVLSKEELRDLMTYLLTEETKR
jgi:putative heme-binding domain-containing protein